MRKAILLLLAAPRLVQDSLSQREAVHVVLRENKALAGSDAAARASAARIDQARSMRLPKVNYSEPFVRSDNPVFVYSSFQPVLPRPSFYS